MVLKGVVKVRDGKDISKSPGVKRGVRFGSRSTLLLSREGSREGWDRPVLPPPDPSKRRRNDSPVPARSRQFSVLRPMDASRPGERKKDICNALVVNKEKYKIGGKSDTGKKTQEAGCRGSQKADFSI